MVTFVLNVCSYIKNQNYVLMSLRLLCKGGKIVSSSESFSISLYSLKMGAIVLFLLLGVSLPGHKIALYPFHLPPYLDWPRKNFNTLLRVKCSISFEVLA